MENPWWKLKRQLYGRRKAAKKFNQLVVTATDGLGLEQCPGNILARIWTSWVLATTSAKQCQRRWSRRDRKVMKMSQGLVMRIDEPTTDAWAFSDTLRYRPDIAFAVHEVGKTLQRRRSSATATTGQRSARYSEAWCHDSEDVQTTPHRTHTCALFLAAHARTQDVITRLAQGLDDLSVCLKSHFTIGHVFVECFFDSVSSYFLITYCLTDAIYCLSDVAD